MQTFVAQGISNICDCCFSRATGREVIFLGGNNDFIGEDGKAYTLQGRAKDGVIYVNPNNGIYISNQVLAEEFIHSIEGTESYTEFVKFVKDLAENTEDINVKAEKAEIKRIYDGAGVEYNLEREFTAQMAAKLLFNDAESVEYLVKNRQSVAGRFFDFLSHYSAKLTGNDEKATVLQARRLLSQALKESEEREITGEVSYSVEYSFNKQVDDALSGKMERGYSVYVGKTPNLLIKAGLPADLPMLINQGHLRTITADREEGDIHLHGIDKDIVKQLPSMLKSPVMIYDSISVDNKDNSVCILTNFKNDIGEPIIVSIKYSETGSKYLDVEFNVQKTDKSNYATSMYGKKNFASHLSDIIDNDAVLYANKSGIEKVLDEKNKTLKLNSDSMLQLLARLDSLGFDTIIHQSRNVVNTYSMQDGGSYSVARKSSATMEQAQKLFNELTYNGELTDAEKLREIYKKDPSLFGMLRDVVEGERTIAEEGNLDYAAPYDEALFIMGLVEDSSGYTSEEVAESEEAAGWQVSDINKDGLLLDAEYAINCSENAHDVCGEIVRGINRLVPGAFGYSAEEISEIKSIWQRAYDDPAGYSAELEAKKAEADEWNVPENGETVSDRAETSIEKSLKKHMGIEEGEGTFSIGDFSDKVENRQSQNDSEGEKIYPSMPDDERAKVISNKKISLVKAKDTEINADDLAMLENAIKSKATPILKKIAEQFKITGKSYTNADVELEFDFSKTGFLRDIHYQKTGYDTYAKMLSVFDEVISNAKGIEVHKDIYKGTIRESPSLEYTYVLASAFYDGDSIIPVQMDVKVFNDRNNTLRLIVSFANKKKQRVMAEGLDINYQLPKATAVSNISIADIVKLVNPEDGDFLKYFPDSMLTEEQIEGKKKALIKQQEKIARLKQGIRSEAKSIDEVTAEMTEQHRARFKTKSKAEFDAMPDTDKLKAAGVTGISGSVGLYGQTEQAIEQKQAEKCSENKKRCNGAAFLVYEVIKEPSSRRYKNL